MPIGRTCVGRIAAVLLGVLSVQGSRAAADQVETVWLRVGPATLTGSGADHLEGGLGAFEVLDEDPSFQGSLEYRLGSKVAFVGPALGLIGNDDDGFFGYVGLYLEVGVGALRFTPMLAAGGYEEGSGVDLGGVFQFRQSLAVSWQFDNGQRLGLKIAHISNADIHDINPGAEDLMITYALPLGPLL